MCLKIQIEMGKFNTLITREFVDPETGEISVLETSKTFTTKVNSDAFYMTFIKFISPIFNLKSKNAQSLLVWMCEHAEYNTGRVFLPTDIRKQITEELEISNNTITNNLKILKDSKLIDGSNGVFTINPQIFWKGDLKMREKLLTEKEIQISFGIND